MHCIDVTFSKGSDPTVQVRHLITKQKFLLPRNFSLDHHLLYHKNGNMVAPFEAIEHNDNLILQLPLSLPKHSARDNDLQYLKIQFEDQSCVTSFIDIISHLSSDHILFQMDG